jgi:hypothetical protein
MLEGVANEVAADEAGAARDEEGGQKLKLKS